MGRHFAPAAMRPPLAPPSAPACRTPWAPRPQSSSVSSTRAKRSCRTPPLSRPRAGGRGCGLEVARRRVAQPPPARSGGRVDHGKAADMARRIAERPRPPKAPRPRTARHRPAAGFTAFERAFSALWANGARMLVACASSLSSCRTAEPGGVRRRRALGRPALALVLAAERVLSPDAPTAAAELLGHLSHVRRFEMLWMFVDKAEHSAAEQIVRRASSGGLRPDDEELAEVLALRHQAIGGGLGRGQGVKGGRGAARALQGMRARGATPLVHSCRQQRRCVRRVQLV